MPSYYKIWTKRYQRKKDYSETEDRVQKELPNEGPLCETSSDSAVSVGSVSLGSISPRRDLNETSSVCSAIPGEHAGQFVPFDGIEGATGGSDRSKGSSKGNYGHYDSDDTFNEYDRVGNELYVNDTSSNNSETSSPSASIEHVNHNHTYPTPLGQQPREVKAYMPKIIKDPALKFLRDEKRAKQMKLPLSVDQIVYLPVEDLNSLLEKFTLNDEQLQLIKDIRRRGKNKVAAQNCRKRKLDEICELDVNVKKLNLNRDRIWNERQSLRKEISEMQEKIDQMYEQIFTSLTDDNGNPYDPSRYRLEFLPDGEAVMLPLDHNSSQSNDTQPSTSRTSPESGAGGGGGGGGGISRRMKKKK